MNASRKSLRGMFMPTLLLITGCGRAPSFNIVGSYFPAWLLCLVVAVLLTVVSRALLNRYVEIVWPVLVYPSLTAIFALASWLVLFR
jgi:hypothetical protein